MNGRTSWTAAELVKLDFPEPKWAIPGLIAEGLTLLVGPPKLGKSWLVLNAGCAIAAGGRALGGVPVEQGDVLYLALEDNGRRLQQRLVAMLGDDPAPARLHLATQLEPLSNGGEDRIRAWLDAHPGARLVVVDVLARVRGRSARDVSVYEADYAAVATLKRIADDHGVAVVVVHHTRKSGAEDFIDTVSGSQGLAGAADTIAVLKRSRGSAGAVLHITGRDVTEAEHALDFDAPTGTWRLLAGPAADYDLAETRRRILAVVRQLVAATPKQVGEALTDIKPATIRLTMRRMFDDDQLDTDGSGSYCEPPLHPVTPVTPVTLPGLSSGDSTSPVTPGVTATHPPHAGTVTDVSVVTGVQR